MEVKSLNNEMRDESEHAETKENNRTNQKTLIDVETENVSFDPTETKRLLRKIDWRVLPPLTVLYILAFVDRSNIGNARIAGMNDDLALTGPQYNMALTVFFFPYALFEVPSNIVLKLMRPSHWLTLLVIAWGTVVTLQGIVRTYEHLIVTRVLLGVTEAGFFPAATYLLTTWYCRWELQTRMAIFFSAASLAGGFSGLLAFGIQHLDGVGGLSGWRWIFIIEGILTVLVGVSIPWILPDGPRSASFLTAEEKCFLFARMQHDIGLSDGEGDDRDQKFDWKLLWSAMADWKIYLAVIIYWGNSISVYGFSFAAPTIIRELGYTSAQAQLLTIPIYLFGACSTIFFARLADRRKTRWVFIVIPFCIALVGYVGVLSIPHPGLPGLTYFFLFFITGGLYPSIIGCISWVGNNLAPSFKRAIGMALLMTVGNLGGAVGSNIFVEDQAPQYWLGYGLSAGIILAAIISTVILQLFLKYINAKRAEMSEVDVCNRFTAEELRLMGDKSPLFRYVY